MNGISRASQFAGNNKDASSSTPLGGTFTGGTPWGMNDNARTVIGGGGGTGVAAIIASAVQAYFALKQLNLAQSYYNTNKQDFDFFVNNYQTNLVAHKNQAFTMPFYTVDYFPMTGASLGRIKPYDEKWLQSRRRAHRYALGHQRHTDYMYYMLRRKAAFAAWIAGRRVEDARKDMKDDQIQTHKIQALNFGISVGNIARQGLATATGTLEKAYDEMGTRIGGLASGLGKYSGYEAGRNGTQKVLNDSSVSGTNMAPQQ